jgi:hypothetical protein
VETLSARQELVVVGQIIRPQLATSENQLTVSHHLPRTTPRRFVCRCLASEVQQLLLLPPQSTGDAELHGYAAWVAAPSRLEAPLATAVRAVGVAAVVELLENSLETGDPTTSVCPVRHHPETKTMIEIDVCEVSLHLCVQAYCTFVAKEAVFSMD